MKHEVFVATKAAVIGDDEFKPGDRVAGDCPHVLTHPGNFERLDIAQARARLRELAADPASVESIDEAPLAARSTPQFAASLRMFERQVRRDELSFRAAERLEGALERDRAGAATEYILAVADPHYNSAFGKLLAAGPQDAALQWTRKEADSFRRVSAAQHARSLQDGASPGGSYAIPFTLDASIVLSGAGAQSPIRRSPASRRSPRTSGTASRARASPPLGTQRA